MDQEDRRGSPKPRVASTATRPIDAMYERIIQDAMQQFGWTR